MAAAGIGKYVIATGIGLLTVIANGCTVQFGSSPKVKQISAQQQLAPYNFVEDFCTKKNVCGQQPVQMSQNFTSSNLQQTSKSSHIEDLSLPADQENATYSRKISYVHKDDDGQDYLDVDGMLYAAKAMGKSRRHPGYVGDKERLGKRSSIYISEDQFWAYMREYNKRIAHKTSLNE